MRTLQLVTLTLGVLVLTACNRADTDREAREAAKELRAAAATAGDRLADSWLTTKVQAQFFADDDIKSRYISVTSRDGVVTLKGHVENEAVRLQALQIAGNTDGVRRIQDELLVGRPATNTMTWPEPEPRPEATTGAGAVSPATAPARDDAHIVAAIQARYFLDRGVKARDIEVDSKSGIVTLRGRVASDSERTQALILARMTEGVQRVEDGLTVDASLAAAQSTGTAGVLPSSAPPAGSLTGAPATPSADTSMESRIKERLSADARLKASQVEVTAKDGVVLVQGTVPDQASKQRALTIARQSEGVVQVVDRIAVAKK
jgi:osmotically-inducible protein OsmY